MANSKVHIPKSRLYTLYHKKGESPDLIASKYGCTSVTILNRLREYSIPLKAKAQAHIKYKRYPFNEDKEKKAYILGFRLGDLNVYRPSTKNTQTIVARTHTTQMQQVVLMKWIFDKYGNVSVSNTKKGGYHINCYLDESFSFLLPSKKYIYPWILKKRSIFFAFVAGYADAEANFGLNQGKARIKIDAYDKDIIRGIHAQLQKYKIQSKCWKIGEKGDKRSDGSILHEDLWRITLNEACCIKALLLNLKPYLYHENRRRDMKKCLQNIEKRTARIRWPLKIHEYHE